MILTPPCVRAWAWSDVNDQNVLGPTVMLFRVFFCVEDFPRIFSGKAAVAQRDCAVCEAITAKTTCLCDKRTSSL